MIKILSLDGGGIAGLFHIYFLLHLEKKLNRPIHQIFDYIGGTSIGGIIALLLANKTKWFEYSDNFRLEDVIKSNLIDEIIKIIFGNSKTWYKFWNSQLFKSKYNHRKEFIKKFYEERLFGNKFFGQYSLTKNMIFSYDLSQSKAKVFKSWRKEHNKYPINLVARATSASPTYFPEVTFKNERFIDGGICANNPSNLIVYEASKIKNDFSAPVTVLSIGCSQQGLISFPNALANAGILSWAIYFLKLVFDSQQRINQYLNGHDGISYDLFDQNPDADNIIETTDTKPKGYAYYHKVNSRNYFRFTPLLPTNIDNVNNLNQYQLIADNFFQKDGLTSKLCNILQ